MSAEGRTPRTWTQERLEATGWPAWSAGAALGLVLAGAFIAVEIATERLALAASVAMRPGLAQDVRIAVITLLAVANVPIACVYAVRLAREALCNYRPSCAGNRPNGARTRTRKRKVSAVRLQRAGRDAGGHAR